MAGSTQIHTLHDTLDLYADGQMAVDELVPFIEQYEFAPIIEGRGFPQPGTLQEVVDRWHTGQIPDEDYEQILDAVGPLSPLEAGVEVKAVAYNPDARDADLDRIVQEGTPFARPAKPAIRIASSGRDEPTVPQFLPRAGKKWDEDEADVFATAAWEVKVRADDNSGIFRTTLDGVFDSEDDMMAEGTEWNVMGEVTFTPRGGKTVTVGEWARTFDPVSGRIKHDLLTIDPEYQHHGFASQWNDHAEGVYERQGFTDIFLTASLDGTYVWALAGFDFWVDDDRDDMARVLAQKLKAKKGLTPEAIEEGERFLKWLKGGYKATAYEFAMLGKDSVMPGHKHLGYEVLHGNTWIGHRDI